MGSAGSYPSFLRAKGRDIPWDIPWTGRQSIIEPHIDKQLRNSVLQLRSLGVCALNNAAACVRTKELALPQHTEKTLLVWVMDVLNLKKNGVTFIQHRTCTLRGATKTTEEHSLRHSEINVAFYLQTLLGVGVVLFSNKRLFTITVLLLH